MSIRSMRGARDGRAVDLTDLRLVDVQPLDGREGAPWVVRPRVNLDLVGWAADGAAEVNRLLLERGVVLLRGFGLTSTAEFEAAAAALTPDLFGGYGDLPRESDSPNIYKSTPYPHDQPILFHNESSHLARWPSRISFFCHTASEQGGETPLADCREIANRLDPSVLAEFESKGLLYLRNFSGVDVSWQQFFHTEDRAEIERRCQADGAAVEWTRGGEQLRVSQPAAAVRSHPVTGDRLFFNQIQLHHPHYLPAQTREAMLELVDNPADLPRNVTFGDGTLIPDEVAEHVLQVYWDTCVMFPWQQGDIATLDNMRVAHARMPFSGERRIAVAMADMITSG